ncbi:hypothetical protein [Kitasatospora sp. NPDC059571]|uniref:hypothetical protein n=1 Tax=Kitasatospora sp. NPDC059571 TaxID=3346871 RepID=UPI0036830880
MRDVFEKNGVFDKVFAVLCLALNLLLLDLGLAQHRQGGSIGWAVTALVLVTASCAEIVRRFRPGR